MLRFITASPWFECSIVLVVLGLSVTPVLVFVSMPLGMVRVLFTMIMWLTDTTAIVLCLRVSVRPESGLAVMQIRLGLQACVVLTRQLIVVPLLVEAVFIGLQGDVGMSVLLTLPPLRTSVADVGGAQGLAVRRGWLVFRHIGILG